MIQNSLILSRADIGNNCKVKDATIDFDKKIEDNKVIGDGGVEWYLQVLINFSIWLTFKLDK